MSFPVLAQGPNADAIPDPFVKHTLTALLKQIHNTPCGLNGRCEPATEAELENPPISLDAARRVIQSGVASGTAQWCEVDWKVKILHPMLAHLRDVEKWNDRQIALAGMIHGVFQANVVGPLEETGRCPLMVKVELERKLPRW